MELRRTFGELQTLAGNQYLLHHFLEIRTTKKKKKKKIRTTVVQAGRRSGWPSGPLTLCAFMFFEYKEEGGLVGLTCSFHAFSAGVSRRVAGPRTARCAASCAHRCAASCAARSAGVRDEASSLFKKYFARSAASCADRCAASCAARTAGPHKAAGSLIQKQIARRWCKSSSISDLKIHQ